MDVGHVSSIHTRNDTQMVSPHTPPQTQAGQRIIFQPLFCFSGQLKAAPYQ